MEGVFCHNCGHRNPDGRQLLLVVRGGAARRGPTETTITAPAGGRPAARPATRSQRSPWSRLPRGAGRPGGQAGPQRRDPLRPRTTTITRAGRHPESDIFLDDITVSRRHAEIERQADGRWSIRDVGSLNGTYVNRERIEEAVLSAGDEVQIGKFKLVYLAAGDE